MTRRQHIPCHLQSYTTTGSNITRRQHIKQQIEQFSKHPRRESDKSIGVNYGSMGHNPQYGGDVHQDPDPVSPMKATARQSFTGDGKQIGST
jgi:hypothetical protein